jgi:carbonic anhydrase
VLRNVGNLVPSRSSESAGESSVPAALEFAVKTLRVRDIVVCGHSSCGAMKGLLARPPDDMPGLATWLRHGEAARERLRTLGPLDPRVPEHDQLSQHNVLVQLEHLRQYPFVREALAAGQLRLHAWWFEIGRADVLVYDEDEGRFVVIDEAHAERMLERAVGEAAPAE